MKLSGMAGKGSGKLGSQVYSSVAGQQIVRAYQPVVSNPNTSPQVNVRARLKLMSQLSAVFSPILAYKRKGMTTPRNAFVKANFDLTSGNDGEAMVSLENIQITNGTSGFPGILAQRVQNSQIRLSLLTEAGNNINEVVYVVFKKTGSAKLQLIGSWIASGSALVRNFPCLIPNVNADLVIYAYGIAFVNSRAQAAYANYNVNSAEDIAKLVMSRKMSFTNYRFTRTRACQLYANEIASRSAGPMEVRVFLTPSGNGNVSGNGIYSRGDLVTIQATPNEGSEFIGWLRNGSDDYVSYSRTMVFEANGLTDLIAVFQNPESSTGGLNGDMEVNPLPSSAVVAIDSVQVSVTSGIVNLYDSFDNVDITGVGDEAEIVYVPVGSAFGDDDNVTFDQQESTYTYGRSGSGSGTIYINGMAWFYINSDAWINDYPDTTITIDGTTVSITNGRIQVSQIPDYLEISGLAANRVVTAFNNATWVPFEKTNNVWKNVNTGVELPLQINVDGAPWFSVVILT